MSTSVSIQAGTIHYLSDGLEMRAPPYYQVHISALAFLITDRNLAVLATEAVVELTMELVSVWASTVDYSDSVMC